MERKKLPYSPKYNYQHLVLIPKVKKERMERKKWVVGNVEDRKTKLKKKRKVSAITYM